MAAEGGQTSKEYSIIQNNFHRIVTSLQQEGILHEAAMKVFEKRLIAPQRLKVYNDSSKASDFVIEILGRIESNAGDFRVFLSCLSTMPTLNKLTSDLQAQLLGPGQETKVKEGQAPAAPDDATIVSPQNHGRLMEILFKHASHWNNIASRLGFEQDELDNIMASPMLLPDAPRSWLRQMLNDWIHRATDDPRGAPTRGNIRRAVAGAGLGDVIITF